MKMLFGPVSCGKSVASCADIFAAMVLQKPSSDGVRYTRIAVIRNSYRQLKSTTIKTWLHWFPESIYGKIKWNSPITHHLRFTHDLYGQIDSEIMFMPIESENDIGNLKSLELTRAYINECQYLPEIVLTTCLERVGRYPHKNSGASPTYKCVIADTNPPSTKHWMYRLEEKLPSNYKFFHYDSAVVKVDRIPDHLKCTKLVDGKHYVQSAISRDGTSYISNPEADYLQYLAEPDYYLNQIPGLTDEEVRVTCMGQYGFTRAGKPVYPDYIDSIHFVNHKIQYNPREKLVMGWDFGLTPACALLQVQNDGSIAQIYEFTSDDFSIEKLAKDVVIPILNLKFSGWQNDYLSFADPSGTSFNQVTYDRRSCISALNQLGIRTKPAKTNNPDLRAGAVSHFLRKSHNGRGAFVITPDSPQTREGMLGDFQFEKIILGTTEESTKAKWLKNFSSHICEAQQYAMLYFHEMVSRSTVSDSPSISTRIY